jgi:hypothetical protein
MPLSPPVRRQSDPPLSQAVPNLSFSVRLTARLIPRQFHTIDKITRRSGIVSSPPAQVTAGRAQSTAETAAAKKVVAEPRVLRATLFSPIRRQPRKCPETGFWERRWAAPGSVGFFQPTTQPTICEFLRDFRIVWQSPRCCKLL